MILWSIWDDYKENFLTSWPQVSGRIYLDEVAVILEIDNNSNKMRGIKICTQRNSIGWISANYLKAIPAGVEPAPPKK
jgi:hypothetical protein